MKKMKMKMKKMMMMEVQVIKTQMKDVENENNDEQNDTCIVDVFAVVFITGYLKNNPVGKLFVDQRVTKICKHTPTACVFNFFI